MAALAAAAMLAAPAGALAADPPTILTAGVDATDALYATWSVAPGTTFEFVTLATVPDPDPSLPEFFAPNNFAGFCDVTHPSATCTTTSYTAGYPLVRDRRYFAKVVAKVTAAPSTYVTSAIWVIDDAKPQVPGDAPVATGDPTNTPVAGHPLAGATTPPPVAPPPPAAPAPAAAMKLLSPPKTIGSLLLKGVRVQVGCTVTCSAFGRLSLGTPSIGTKTLTLTNGGAGTLTIKPKGSGRTRLRGRSRARIKVVVNTAPFGGKTQTLTKSFTVRR